MSMPAESKTSSERPSATVSVLPARGARPLRQRLRLPLMVAGPLVVLLLGGYYYVTGGRFVSTDDAYTQSARTTISANVGGEVAEIDVQDNQKVAKGDVLFRLDARPYQITLDEAQAQLAAAKLQVEALKATYRQKQADLKAAQDTAAFQQREYDRRKTLAENGVYPKAQLDQALHVAENARQQVISTQQQMANILASLGGAVDMPVEKHPSIRQAQAQAQALVDRAALNLSYATVRAPDKGVVTKVEQLQVGDHINAATPLFSLVSTDDLWIEANFKRPPPSTSTPIPTTPSRPRW
ncbi:MAG: HlyD family secretion protein [Alphaproteobacteria bacterium]|nr:HlyD family secretion protein [Alphaproteobacteria bacterium]